MLKDLYKFSNAEVKRLARLGDSLVNFLASAVLTLKYKTPHGVKVPDKVLRAAAGGLLKGGRDLKPEDLVEALIGLAWLKGKDVEEMLAVAIKAAREGDTGEETIRIALQSLVENIISDC